MRWAVAFAFVCLSCVLSLKADAQESGGTNAPAAPTPAPPAANKLPEVEVIQKEAKPAPKTVQKAAPKKKQVVAPPPAPPAAPVAPVETAGTGGIDSGTVQMSPVQGSSLPISKFPGAVGRASSSDVQRGG